LPNAREHVVASTVIVLVLAFAVKVGYLAERIQLPNLHHPTMDAKFHEFEDWRLIATRAERRALRPSQVSGYWYRRGVASGVQPSSTARGQFDLGVDYLHNDDLEHARTCLDAATAGDPSYAPAWVARGRVSAWTDQLETALSDFERASVLDSSFAEDRAIDYYRRAGDYEPARLRLQALMERPRDGK
jgi:tetratricopeptide (TPR) repeat protein